MEIGCITVSSRQKSFCPLLSIVKATFFALIAAFVLCMPLGDPSICCDYSETGPTGQGTKCSLCDVYLIWRKVAKNTMRAMDFGFRAFKDALYQTKLKFYSLLETIDKEDLCRSVCCSESSDSVDHRRPCRCPRKCGRKR